MSHPNETPELDNLPRAAAAFARAIDSLRRDIFLAAGVSLTELRTLTRIADAPGINPSTLASELDLGGAAVTSITDGLVGRGLVQRVGDPNDRRRVTLRLTSDGHAIADATGQQFSARILEASEGLGVAALRGITSSLEHLAAGLVAGPSQELAAI